MADHVSYEDSIKSVYKGLLLLAVVTLIEVFLSLLGKGYVIPGAEDWRVVIYAVGLGIIGLSIYKAYFIIFEFMHMRYEVKTLAMSVLLPVILLVWALVAFFQEGDFWKDRRQQIKEFDARQVEPTEVGDRYDPSTIELQPLG